MSQTFNSVSLWKNSCFLDGLGILLCDYHIAMQFHRVGFPSTKSAFLKSELSGLANVQPHPPRSVFPSSGGSVRLHIGYGRTSHFDDEVGFPQELLLKNQLLRADFLGFDRSDCIVLMKNEILITTGVVWQMESALRWSYPQPHFHSKANFWAKVQPSPQQKFPRFRFSIGNACYAG